MASRYICFKYFDRVKRAILQASDIAKRLGINVLTCDFVEILLEMRILVVDKMYCLRPARIKLQFKIDMIRAKRSFVKCGDWIVILSYAPACLHTCVSFNNEKNCREISEHKIAVCEKTAGLWSGNSSDLDSASLKVLVPVNIFQF